MEVPRGFTDELCIACEEVPPRSLPNPIPDDMEVMFTESVVGKALYCEGCFEGADHA